MTKQEIGRINFERLLSWMHLLTAAHSTPAVLVAVGHDDKAGYLTVLSCELLPDTKEDVALLLRQAADAIDAGEYQYESS